MKSRYQNRIELLQGTLDLLILQTLQWGAAAWLRHQPGDSINSGEVLQVDTGSLYPALHRLERQEMDQGRMDRVRNNQRVKVYRLTAAGKKTSGGRTIQLGDD